MMVDYPLFSLSVIYIGLYYVSIKKVITSKTFTKIKKYVLISIVLFIPIVGVFVPLFMLAEEENDISESEIDYSVDNSDKIELLDTSISWDSD